MPRRIILSPGHGYNTAGKRSPDGSLKEWEFNRRLCRAIANKLTEEHIDYIILDFEDRDVPLVERIRKANNYGRDCLYVSIHGNAAGNGTKWMKARGWAIYTSKGYTKADPMAAEFIKQADKYLPQLDCKVRRYSYKKNEEDWEENFYVLKNSIMPAVLTENLFYDNKTECEIMKSQKGIDILATIHAEAIKEILCLGL